MATRILTTLGIDEAGRGPAIGPMVMAAVALDTYGARKLTRAGLRDSKIYGATPQGRQRRLELADKVLQVAKFSVVRVVDVAEIDRRVRLGELNVLEREVACAFIQEAPDVDRIVADGKVMFAPLRARYPHLDALNKAESKHASVAAASILAKTRRDQAFERIHNRYEPLFGAFKGGGYVNDATRTFLRAYAHRFGRLPPEARRSWPHPYLRDIFGENFDPFDDVPDDLRGQTSLFAQSSSSAPMS